MEIDVEKRYQDAHETLNGWKEEIEETRPIVQAIWETIKDIEEPEGTHVGLGPSIVGDLSFTITGLDSFQDLQEILEALAKVFGPPISTNDDPGQKLRSFWFKDGDEDFRLDTWLSYNATGCKVVTVGEEVVPEHTVQKLKFICEGDPEWGDFGTIGTREEA